MISRDFESKSFYHANPVITEVIQYQFEPCEHDKVRVVTQMQTSAVINRGDLACPMGTVVDGNSSRWEQIVRNANQ